MNYIIWLLPLFSGVCDAASRTVIKATKIHAFTLISAGFFFALPYYLIWLYIEGMPIVKPTFWIAVGIHIPLLMVANILTVEAHRRSPLILTMPYLSFTPAFLLITAPLMGIAKPTLFGGLGVVILTGGLYIINTQSGQAGLLAPFRLFLKEQGSWMMLIVAFIFAITANLDFIAFKNSNGPFYLLVDHGLAGLLMACLSFAYYIKAKRKNAIKEENHFSPRGSYKVLIFFGTVIAMSIILHILAFKWIPVVPYVIAGKRAGAIIFTVISGFIMAFIICHKDFAKEKENLKYRIPGTLIMIVGMLMIILWGKV